MINYEDIDKILSFFPISQALIFFALFVSLYYVNKQKHFLYISLYKLFIIVFFAMSFMFYYKVQNIVALTFNFSIPIILLFLPIFYLYVDCLTTPNKSLKPKIWFHFFPSIFTVLVLSPYMFMPFEEKILFVSGGFGKYDSNWIVNYITFIYRFGVFFIINAQILVYVFLFRRLFKRHKRNIEQLFSYKENIDLRWLSNLMLIFLLSFIVLNFTRFLDVRHDVTTRIIFNICFGVVNLYIGIRAVIQPNIFSLIRDNDSIAKQMVDDEITINIKSDTKIDSLKEKYSGSSLTEETKEIIVNQINEYMTTKPYRNSKLTVEDVADALNTNTRYLSQIINEKYQVNFFNFINNYRILEAVELLKSPDADKYTIEGIAQMVGFNSKSSFNTSFKKNTGLTPSEIRK